MALGQGPRRPPGERTGRRTGPGGDAREGLSEQSLHPAVPSDACLTVWSNCVRKSVMEPNPEAESDDTPLFVDLALFDGIVVRRVIAYGIDVLLLAVLGGIAALLLGFLGL